jgi:hypothetical protein
MHRFLRGCAAVALFAAAACSGDSAPPTAPEPPKTPPAPVGVYTIEVTGIGTDQMRSSISSPNGGARAGGPSGALTVAGSGITFEQVSSSSFTEGTRSGGGQRYVTFTYRVRNGTGAALNNLTMLMVSRAGTIAGTPISSLARFDGTAANPAIATQVVPTGAAALRNDLVTMQGLYPDVLQVLEESEVAAITPPGDVTGIFPYGYVVRNASSDATRMIPAATLANQYDGVLTLSFRIPLQPTSSQDVFSFFFQVLAVQDSETRMTESIEEAQDTAAVRRLRERAAALGATTVTVLAGSTTPGSDVADYPGQRQICSVRTAGTAASPTRFITSGGFYTEIGIFRPGETPDACGAYFRTGTALPANYGMPYDVIVQSMDRYGNRKATPADSITLTSTDGTAVMPAKFALAPGLAGVDTVTLTYTTYGASTLNAAGRRLRGSTPVSMIGMTRTWDGDVDTNWFTNGDWIQNYHPGVQDSVIVPGDRPFYPLLIQNTSIRSVTLTPGGSVQPTINLSSFDLTASGSVALGNTGTFTGTGRLILAGTTGTVGGGISNFDVRNLRVTGSYSASSNLNVTGGRIVVQGGRLRSQGFRVRVRPS